MATSPFDIAKHINSKTPFEFPIGDFVPWMNNKIFSNTLDTLFFAEAMNRYSGLDKDIQYSFFLHAIPKKTRYGKWNTASTINTDTELIMNCYQVSLKVAEGYLKIMSPSALKQLQEKMHEGGKK